MAIASANANAKIMVVLIDDSASGFLPMASTAFPPIIPIPAPGPIAPNPIAIAVANNFIASGDIVYQLPSIKFNC